LNLTLKPKFAGTPFWMTVPPPVTKPSDGS
jgi:hypothetical protein